MADPEALYPSFEPSFVPPTENILREVATEYEDNPVLFRTRLQLRLDEENPELFPLFFRDLTNPAPHLAVRWASLYYEMLSRSAKSRGLSIPKVSRKNFNAASNALEKEKLDLKDPDFKRKAALLDLIHSKRLKYRHRDEALGIQMIVFWATVDEEIEIESKRSKLTYPDLIMITNTVSVIQESLYLQLDEDALVVRYSA